MPLVSILFLIGFLNALHRKGGNLAIYLTECGFEKDVIGIFFLLSLPFSCKILWSPVIDYVKLPFFANSPRKGWFTVALLGMAASFACMGAYSAKTHPWLFGASLFFVALFSGCLYMVGIAYELESLDPSDYTTGSSCFTAGYRTGLLYIGAGVLYIAHVASWQTAFYLNAAVACTALVAIVAAKEPYKSLETVLLKRKKLQEHPNRFRGIFLETIVEPIRAFFKTKTMFATFAMIVLFKVSDHMAKPMEGPFYIELGFTKHDLALAAKTFGFFATLFGAFCAAAFIKDKNSLRVVALLSLIHTFSELGCYLHCITGKSYLLLYATSGFSNCTAGMLMSLFIALLWKSCDKEHAAIQYAFLWSLSGVITTCMASFGALLAAHMAWNDFFLTVSCTGVASSLLLMLVSQKSKETASHLIRSEL